MRAIAMCVAGFLLGVAAWGQSEAHFYGARLTPGWNANGGIDVYVSNQTKLPIGTDRLAVDLHLASDQPCHFNYERRLDLAPAETVKLTIADAQAARKCIETQSTAARTASPRALRFVRPPIGAPQPSALAIAPKRNALTVDATWQVHGRVLRSQTHWLVEPASR